MQITLEDAKTIADVAWQLSKAANGGLDFPNKKAGVGVLKAEMRRQRDRLYRVIERLKKDGTLDKAQERAVPKV